MQPKPESTGADRTILFFNAVLARRTGTELWVEDHAFGLMKRGWKVSVLAGELGPLAKRLENAGILCRTNPAELTEAPTVILSSFTIEALRALAAFPGVPVVWLQHDGRAALQTPLRHPRIVSYAGVDDFCRERIHRELRIDLDRVAWLPNRVDLQQFRSRITPLPNRPTKAAIFSNQAHGERSVPLIRAACAELGVSLDVWGEQSGRPLAAPAGALPSYDIVFAKARCALEALACGCSVVLCDELGGLGPRVTSANWSYLRRWNLGQRVLGKEITTNAILERIRGYDPHDAAAVNRLVRDECGLTEGIADLETWLLSALAKTPNLSPDQELAAYAHTLENLAAIARHVSKLEVAAYGRWPNGAPLQLLKTLHRWQHRLRPWLRRLRQ